MILLFLLIAGGIVTEAAQPAVTVSGLQIKLIGGSKTGEGRVEIRLDDTHSWGTICDDFWGEADATVVCRMFGYKFGTARRYASFGQGSGPIYMDNVQCQGNEPVITNCSYSGWETHNCRHREDAGVTCFNYDVRLVGVGGNTNAGAVQIREVDGWKSVCDSQWDDNAAKVVCKQLQQGFTYGKAYCCSKLTPYTWDYRYRSVTYTNFSCNGNEQKLQDCTKARQNIFCPRRHRASVACFSSQPSSSDLQFGISIFNGSSSGSSPMWGMLKVKYQGVDGVSCANNWNDVTANIACKQLNKAGGIGFGTSVFRAPLPSWISNYNCSSPSETNLQNCVVAPWGEPKNYCRPNGLLCYSNQAPTVQLVGSGPRSGRVEVSFNGQTGTICDNSWSNNDARVVCKTMGFVDGIAFKGSYYGRGSGTIFLDRLYCNGRESTIFGCPNRGWTIADQSCIDHSKDASVVCYNEVRLVSGDHSHGVVQVKNTRYRYTYWTPLCGTGFTDIEAKVVCKEMGFDNGKALPLGAYGRYYSWRGYARKNITCTGSEESILNCTYASATCTTNGRTNYASVACYNGTLDDTTSVTLEGGSPGYTSKSGRVIVTKHGVKGRVCGQYWDNVDASIACKQIDSSNRGGVAYKFSQRSNGPYWLSELGCFGNETSLFQCPVGPEGCSSNYYYKDAGVLCYTRREPYLSLVGGTSTGQVKITYESESGYICDDRYMSSTTAKVICKQLGFTDGIVDTSTATGGKAFIDSPYCRGYETSIFQCTNSGWRSKSTCSKQARVRCFKHVKLSLGSVTSTSAQGQVQLFVQNQWKTVCGDMFDDNEAGVACRELGFNYGKALAKGSFGSRYVSRYARNTVGGFNCTGSELSLANCSFNASPNNCPRNYLFANYASVSCSNTPLNTGFTVGLDDNFPSDVTVNMYGIDGTICSDMWGDEEANVVCKQMGYQSGIAIGPSNYYSYNNRKARLLSSFNCTGTEGRLQDCSYSTTIPTSCQSTSRKSNARVYCFDTQHDVSISLINGPTGNQGIVQITIDGRPGTLCASSFSSRSAKVLCKQMGYLDGTSQSRTLYGNTTGFSYMYSPSCDGTEGKIWNCKNKGWNVTSSYCAAHNRDARVKCTGYVRLRPNTQYGAVQLYDPSVRRYGLVCAENFTDVDASVACAEMGYEYGISICCSAFGYQYNSLAYAKMSCNGREPSLINCTYETSLTYCPSRKYASVACSNIASSSGYDLKIGSSTTASLGRVSVKHMGIWGYVCTDGFDDNEATVICKMKGFAGGFAYVYGSYYSSSTSMRWLSNIQCGGTESSLSRCKGMVWGGISTCSRYGNAAVYCYQTSGLELRLNGTKKGYGRVQVAIDGVWGRMCSGSSYNTANTVCKQLGFTGGNSVSSSRSSGGGPIYIRSVYCNSNSESLNQCSITWGTTRYCRELSVQCYGKVRLNGYYHLPNYGRVEMKLTDSWVPVCDDKFTDTAAQVVCKNLGYVDGKKQCCSAIGLISSYSQQANITIDNCRGTESSLTECQYTPGVCATGKYVTVLCSNNVLRPSNITVRLPSSSTNYRGAVDAQKYGFYGPICGSGWTDANANVTCKQLGFLGGIAEKSSTSYTYRMMPMVLGGYNCTGLENNLDMCPSKGFDEDKGCESSRYYRQKATVLCYNSGGIRLDIVNGTVASAGRVQLTYGGISGRVCITYDSDNVASVACRQMGYKGGFADRTTYPPYTAPSGTTKWLSGLSCNGEESSLLQCTHNWKPRTSYYRYRYRYRYRYNRCRDLGVVCYNDIRLTGGNHLSTGSIEVNINNNWGSVCDHNWKAENTRVACKQLGYDDGITACCSAYGNHPKAIIENVNCAGTESRLQDCTHDNPHTSSCYKHNVAVICYKGTKPTTYTWKLGGGNNYTGEVLVDYMGSTGRICSDNWDDNDARVVCKALGFRNGTAYNHARFDYYYASHGPFWLSNVGCSGNEANLTDCPLPTTPLGGVSTCNSGKAAGVLCADISGIYYRINGPQDNLGRVEVSVNGVWGSICNTRFDSREANVLCRTLGYSDGRAQVVSYPNPSGPVFKSNFQCTGDEDNLAACPHQGWVKATDYWCSGHRRDAAVICYDQVRLATGFGPDIKQGPVQYYNNGTWNLVCDTNFNDLSAKRLCQDIGFFDGKAICCSAYGTGFQFWYNGGYKLSNMTMACTGNENSAMDCLQENTCDSQSYASAICFNDTDVINENYDFHFHDSTDKSGRIEVSHYNTKGRICSTFWDDTNAKVYCKKRGYPDGIAYHSSRWTWTSITERGPFWVSSMNCTGSEPSLKNCSFTDRLTLGNCSKSDVGAVACFEDTTGIQYRLAGGDKKEGRVEIGVGGVWGTVCDLYWDKREAGVLCRSLGYSDGYPVRGAHYGPGSGPIWLSMLRCTGTETDLHKCPHNGFQSEIVDGTSYSWRKCKSHDDDASVVCVDKLKLNLGLNASMGAVEVYVSPTWLGVCDDGFDDNAAAVVCRTMGYPNGVKLPGSSFGVTDGPIGVTNVKCSAVMKTFSQCAQTISRTCSSGLYASVYCSMDDIVDDGIKVELDPDTTSGQSGLVKVHKGGVWGSVCMAGIDKQFASVACREFGFGGGIPYTSREKDTRPILMADVKCNGAESSVKDCSFTAKSKTNWCDYYAPRAGVLCYNSSMQFRLSGDADKSRGRIEMNVDGQWGAFCNPWSDSRIGKVVCKQQGFVDGIMVSGNKYISPDDEPMWYTSTRCIGNESSITTCSSDGFQYNSYYRRYYEWSCRRRTGPISVQCYNQEFKISQLRLADGTKSSGRVEVYLDGPNLWGTVCDDYWSDIDATVVCNQLGFATGTAVKRAKVFGQGTGPIWLDNVACTGSEMNLKDCPSNGFSVHNCQHTEDAGVTCTGVYVPPTSAPIIVPTKTTDKGNPVTEKITGDSGSGSGTAAAIAVPIVIIVIVGAVLGFLYYRRYGNRFKDLREDLVGEPHGGGGVSLRPSGAFFSKFRSGGTSSSSQPGVTNPSYEFAQPSTFSSESDT